MSQPTPPACASATSQPVTGLEGPQGIVFDADALPAGLDSVRALERLPGDKMDILSGKTRNPTLEFAVSRAVRDTLVWTSRMIIMIFLRCRMKTVYPVDWMPFAHLVLDLDVSTEVQNHMRGHVLAVCETGTRHIADIESFPPMSLDVVVSSMFRRIVMLGEPIWDFFDDTMNQRTALRMSEFDRDAVVRSVDLAGGVWAPFVGTRMCEVTHWLPPTIEPYCFTSEKSCVYQALADTPCTAMAFFGPECTINIRPLANAVRMTVHFAETTTVPVGAPGLASRILCDELERTAPCCPVGQAMLECMIRSALMYHATMKRPVDPEHCSVTSPMLASMKAAMDKCASFAAHDTHLFRGDKGFGSWEIDLYTELVVYWTPGIARVARNLDTGDQHANLVFACLLVLGSSMIRTAADMAQMHALAGQMADIIKTELDTPKSEPGVRDCQESLKTCVRKIGALVPGADADICTVNDLIRATMLVYTVPRGELATP